MNEILKFSVNNIELVDKIEEGLFRRVKIRAFASGENSHTQPIEEDVLKRGAKTIYNKPILWKYNQFLDDAEGHEPDEVPCGFVPETEKNPIELQKEDGRTYIGIQALLWTRYCGRLIDIFKRDDMKKDVSVEIAYVGDSDAPQGAKPKVKDFVVTGVTILGEMINPACKGCEAELLEFSEDKDQYLRDVMMGNVPIRIDNSKESAMSGSWRNPRHKLFTPISRASNSKELLKEAYLIGEFGEGEPEITKFKYPHHVLREGVLVIHRDGLQAAFQRAAQQGIVEGKVKSHLLRHYRELGLSTENFSEFNISEEDFNIFFAEDLKESAGETDMPDENKDVSEEIVEVRDEDIHREEPHDEEAHEECHESEENHDEEECKEDACEEGSHDEEMSCETLKEEMCKMTDRIRELEEQNAAYMSKIEAMSDYEELKKFKMDTEERVAREKEMCEMEAVMSEIEERGVSMSEDDKAEFKAKILEFSSIDAWANYVKAQAFDRVENMDGIVKIGLPYTSKNPKPRSIWDEI